MNASPRTFLTRRKVRFGDCDPAGIVFYPRYFEMLNEAVEDWFEAIGSPFSQTHVAERMATPIRAVEAQFPRSSRLGEVLEFSLRLVELGRTSAKVEGVALCGGEERFRARFTMIYVDLGSHAATPWPDHLRAAMSGGPPR